MPSPQKPRPLRPGDAIRVIAPASPMNPDLLRQGIAELERLGYTVHHDARLLARDGFFAGTTADRRRELLNALREPDTRAIIATRGGYGSGYLLDATPEWDAIRTTPPKLFLGYSDVTSLQVFLWRKFGWVSLYGPMVAAGLDHGADAPEGYNAASFAHAISETQRGWAIELQATTLAAGQAEGTLLGGCLTLVEMTLGTPWELDTRGAILVLEDRGMKPWQVDRALTHLRQAGKLAEIRALLFGDFPDCEPPAGTASVKDVVAQVCAPLNVPITWGAPIGHTPKPLLTIPLGVRARLVAENSGRLEILEPACIA